MISRQERQETPRTPRKPRLLTDACFSLLPELARIWPINDLWRFGSPEFDIGRGKIVGHIAHGWLYSEYQVDSADFAFDGRLTLIPHGSVFLLFRRPRISVRSKV